MAQATSGEKLITIDGEKYKVRTQVVYQDGLGVPGTLSTTAPIKYTVEYKPLSPSPLQQWITLGERDNRNNNNWVFTPAAGTGFQKSLIENGPNSLTTSLDDATSNALSKSSGVTKQQATQILQVAPNVAPIAPAPVQPQPVRPTEPAAVPDPVPNDPVDIEDPGITALGSRENYDNYYYPKTLRGNQNKQDIIKFTAFSYGSRKLAVKESTKDSFGTPGLGERTFGEIKGSVTLPIQPSITDANTVEWGGENLNPLQAFGAAVAYGAQTDIAGAAQQLGNETERLFRDSNFKNAARIFLAGKAVGVNGLLSRIGGAVLNPNMELLFQGPQLRPFSFTFRLSPRDRDEAKQVKYIIRFFKQNMSIKNTADNIFLKAPNIFEIKYINGVTGNDHTSLNRIKRCALQSCSVDYTPDGSYMTFNDPDSGHPMTSYNLTLQFQELEPVTEKDYNDLNDLNAIGY
jgi:hypothetical protein